MEITQELIDKIDEVLARGLCVGVGYRDGQMCVEAAICYALGEPHGDDPSCVEPAVREFKIALNDSLHWGAPETRARGMRNLAIAQLGSRGVVDPGKFVARVAERTVRELVPALLRETSLNDPAVTATALRCEVEGTASAAYAAAHAALAANHAADAARAADHSADAAYHSVRAADAAASAGDQKYLLMSAQIALEVLQELGSPGCEWLDK